MKCTGSTATRGECSTSLDASAIARYTHTHTHTPTTEEMTPASTDLTRALFFSSKDRESEHVRSSVSTQQEGHDRSQVPSSQRSTIVLFPATLFCRSRDFVKSSAERAHRWTRDAHRARGIAWTLFMRRERGPRLDMELVDGSGKGVARGKERDEDEAGVSHFIHGGCLKLGSQCSVRCFAIVIRSCTHDLRSREPLQKIPLHSISFVENVCFLCMYVFYRRS